MNTAALRIVRLANFVAPSSGGLRTALRELGKGFKEAGHDPVLIVPGERHTDRETEQDRKSTRLNSSHRIRSRMPSSA